MQNKEQNPPPQRNAAIYAALTIGARINSNWQDRNSQLRGDGEMQTEIVVQLLVLTTYINTIIFIIYKKHQQKSTNRSAILK